MIILSVLQIRRGNRDNFGIFSIISPLKHILRGHNMFSLRNKNNCL